MSDHAGFEVHSAKRSPIDERESVFINVSSGVVEVAMLDGKPATWVLPTLESAEALRDALSAFITFHRRFG